MTRQQLLDIDSLIDWLDHEQDGAEDAGSVARSATNWHPALVAMKAALAALRVEREQDTLAFQHALAQKDAERDALLAHLNATIDWISAERFHLAPMQIYAKLAALARREP